MADVPQWLAAHQAAELLRKKRQGIIPWEDGEQERVRVADESAAVAEAQRIVEAAQKAALNLDAKVKRPQGRPSRRLGKGGMTGIAAVENALRTREIVELRSKGYTHQEIADEIGLHPSTITRILQQFVDTIKLESADAWRAFELQRLQKLEQIAMQKMEKFVPVIQSGEVVHHCMYDSDGNTVLDANGKPLVVAAQDDSATLSAINTMLKISNQRCNLLGLNINPAQHVVTFNGGDVDTSITLNVVDAKEGSFYTVGPEPSNDPSNGQA